MIAPADTAAAARGVLVIWNRIDAVDDAEFNAWYDGEHVNERLAVPGFLSATRYRDSSDPSRYCAVYDTDSVGVLGSAAYRARLADPTPATRSIMTRFRDMHRAACDVGFDVGPIDGAKNALAIALLGGDGNDPSGAPGSAARGEISEAAFAKLRDAAAAIAQSGGLRIRLALPDTSMTGPPSPEQLLRGAPDALPPPMLLIEADTAAACRDAATALAGARVPLVFDLLSTRRR